MRYGAKLENQVSQKKVAEEEKVQNALNIVTKRKHKINGSTLN